MKREDKLHRELEEMSELDNRYVQYFRKDNVRTTSWQNIADDAYENGFIHSNNVARTQVDYNDVNKLFYHYTSGAVFDVVRLNHNNEGAESALRNNCIEARRAGYYLMFCVGYLKYQLNTCEGTMRKDDLVALIDDLFITYMIFRNKCLSNATIFSKSRSNFFSDDEIAKIYKRVW